MKVFQFDRSYSRQIIVTEDLLNQELHIACLFPPYGINTQVASRR